MYSCQHERTTVETVCGGVVYRMTSTVFTGNYIIQVKVGSEFQKIYVYPYEFEMFDVGDTIKCDSFDNLKLPKTK